MNPIYGPVPSWRLGRSLGIDLICREKKVCSFDCVYCQLGKTEKKILERKIFVETGEVERNLREIIDKVKADVVTFSGTGEPTLAKNLGETVKSIKEITKLPLAILTNASLFYKGGVREELKGFDWVIGKLDAPNQEVLEKINSPPKEITFENLLEGLKQLSKEFPGKFSLQMMFVEENENYADELAELAKEIMPDEVQINTPLRPCQVRSLDREKIKKIKEKFSGLTTITVYDKKIPKVEKINKLEVLKRRGIE